MKAKIAPSFQMTIFFCIKQNFVLNAIILLLIFMISNIMSILKSHIFSILVIFVLKKVSLK